MRNHAVNTCRRGHPIFRHGWQRYSPRRNLLAEGARQALSSEIRQFLELVNCSPREVIDTHSAARQRVLAEAAAAGGAKNWEMPFGKHRGKALEDIPDGYLQWAVRILRREASRGFRKFQERARAELVRRQT